MRFHVISVYLCALICIIGGNSIQSKQTIDDQVDPLPLEIVATSPAPESQNLLYPQAISSVVGVAASAANSVMTTVSNSAETIQRLENEVKDDLQKVRTTFQSSSRRDGGSWIRICRVLATASLLTTLGISFTHLVVHLRRFHNPPVQKHIARIIILVPVYGIMSWVAMMLPDERAMFDLVRDTYEAFALYSFLNYLFAILGGEEVIMHSLANSPPVPWMWPLDRLFPPLRVTPRLFDLIKLSVLQFVLVVPFCSVLGFVIRAAGGTTDPYDFSLMNASLWSSFLQSTSISLSMNALWVFYLCTRDLFPPHDCVRPLAQFLTIKAVVFLPYWQNLGLTLLGHSGLLPPSFGSFSSAAILVIMEEFLVCIELLPLALLHCWAFPVELSLIDTPVSTEKMDAYEAVALLNGGVVGATHALTRNSASHKPFAPLVNSRLLSTEKGDRAKMQLNNFASPSGALPVCSSVFANQDSQFDSYGSTAAPSSLSGGVAALPKKESVELPNHSSRSAVSNEHSDSVPSSSPALSSSTNPATSSFFKLKNPLFSSSPDSSPAKFPKTKNAPPPPPSSQNRGVGDILQFVASAYAPTRSSEPGEQSSLSEALFRMRSVFDTRDVLDEVTGLMERTRARLYHGDEHEFDEERRQLRAEEEGFEDEGGDEGLHPDGAILVY
eukprot:GDKJ01002939.1.p1 GENE.GDKJ01002939.1~~GDKJ01002939.1.p1  ORF type:complete len:668 (-),score=153.83 GDKJ01002939.1:123-2126(-)